MSVQSATVPQPLLATAAPAFIPAFPLESVGTFGPAMNAAPTGKPDSARPLVLGLEDHRHALLRDVRKWGASRCKKAFLVRAELARVTLECLALGLARRGKDGANQNA
jgi:hypothetical protein